MHEYVKKLKNKTMPLELISTPRRTDTPIDSDVAAGLTQLPYRFQRKDESHLGSSDNGGFHRILIGVATPAGVIVGSSVYVFGADAVLGVCTVTAVGLTDVTVDKQFTVSIGAGFINYNTGLEGYKILVEPVHAITGISFLPYPEGYRPKQDGSLFVSVSALIAIVRTQGISLNYRLRYHEYYNGIIQSTDTDLAVFSVAAKKQMLDIGGSNMYEFLLNAEPLAKPATKFLNPVHWLGWRTYLHQILDKDVLTRNGSTTIGFAYEAFTVNKELIAGVDGRIIPAFLPQIQTDWIAPELDSISNSHYIRVRAIDNDVQVLNRELFYLVKKPCANAIMLEWLNANGVGEQWLFQVMQDVSNEAQPGQIYEKPVTDTIDNVSDTLSRITVGSVQRITLFADQLTPDQIRALHGIKDSLILYLWLDKIGEKKIKVIVEDNLSTPVNTKTVLGSFSCTIRLPQNFDFYKND